MLETTRLLHHPERKGVASMCAVGLLNGGNVIFALTRKNGCLGRLNKGCIHQQCTGGQPISTTSSQSSSCATKATTVNLSDVHVPSKWPSNSQAISAALSQASLVQLYSAQLKHTGAQLSQGR